MGNFNRVILMGNLTRDPELKHTSGGQALAKFGIATNETYGGKDGTEKKQRATFVDVVAWGKTGEIIAEHLRRGDPIFIEGRLDFSSWKDTATGQNRSKLEVVVQSFQFVGPKKEHEVRRVRDVTPNQDIPF